MRLWTQVLCPEVTKHTHHSQHQGTRVFDEPETTEEHTENQRKAEKNVPDGG